MDSREEFEKRNTIPDDAFFNEDTRSYKHKTFPTVRHPIDDSWCVWQEAWDLLQARVNELEEAAKKASDAILMLESILSDIHDDGHGQRLAYNASEDLLCVLHGAQEFPEEE